MRLSLLAFLFALAPAIRGAAATAAREGTVTIESGPGPLTPWLALASVALVLTLFAAQWLVSRRPRE